MIQRQNRPQLWLGIVIINAKSISIIFDRQRTCGSAICTPIEPETNRKNGFSQGFSKIVADSPSGLVHVEHNLSNFSRQSIIIGIART